MRSRRLRSHGDPHGTASSGKGWPTGALGADARVVVVGALDGAVLPETPRESGWFLDPVRLRCWEDDLLVALGPRAEGLTGYPDYFRTRLLEHRMLRSLLPHVLTLSNRHEAILELGSGLGFNTALLAPHGHRVIGVDIPEAYEGYLPGHTGTSVELARELVNRRLGLDHVELAEAWPHAIDLPDASISLVTSMYTLEHIPALEPVARELWRVTRPGSLMVHVVPTVIDAIEPLLLANINVPIRELVRSVGRRVRRRSRNEYRISANGTIVPPWHSEFLHSYRDQPETYRLERMAFPFVEVGFELTEITQTREHNRVLVFAR